MQGNGAEPTIVCVEFRMKYCHESLRIVVLLLGCHCSFVLESVGPGGLSGALFHSQDENSTACGMKLFMVLRARDVPQCSQ